jgi:hypothetical protein
MANRNGEKTNGEEHAQMNYQLAETVIATFQSKDAKTLSDRLSNFSYRNWKGIYTWLDASGLALYFLDRLRVLDLENAIPPRVLLRLKENAADNRERTNYLFEEFVEINREFKRAGLLYANLKGFTLAPDAFAEAALRCQLDLDFLIAHHDVSRCQQILERRGYLLTGTGDDVREFKADSGEMPSLRDLYRAKPQRCVEIHFANSRGRDRIHLQDDRLLRLNSRRWRGLDLPVLFDCDKFIAQALHLFKHLNSEWTRAAWILECANFINFNEQNEILWVEVQEHVLKSEEILLAVGAATLVSSQSFDIPRLPEVLAWAIKQLPQRVKLWIEEYGKIIMSARFPGTKLYLLLRRALPHTENCSTREVSEKLFPLRQPARITVKGGNKKLSFRLRRMRDEVRYFFFAYAFTWNKVAVT